MDYEWENEERGGGEVGASAGAHAGGRARG